MRVWFIRRNLILSCCSCVFQSCDLCSHFRGRTLASLVALYMYAVGNQSPWTARAGDAGRPAGRSTSRRTPVLQLGLAGLQNCLWYQSASFEHFRSVVRCRLYMHAVDVVVCVHIPSCPLYWKLYVSMAYRFLVRVTYMTDIKMRLLVLQRKKNKKSAIEFEM